jgi:DNA (cytosine-5)-methyltransferase 1
MVVAGTRPADRRVARRANPTSLRFIDLFAGCGGLALGFSREGFRPVGAVEWNADAAETYRANIDETIEVADIGEVVDWPRADIVVGGPPCQGFSQLGNRDPKDLRNRLWREYVRALDESGADMFVMENVPQLLRSAQFELFRKEVGKRGFVVSSRVLCAADFGVPQTRHRAIVLGSRLGLPLFPEQTHGLLSRRHKPHVTVRQAFTKPSILPEVPHGANWHVARPNVRPTSIARYRAVPKDGGNRFQMQANLENAGHGDLVPDCWRRKPTGTTDVFGRLWWDRPALTVRTEFFKPEKGRYLHPSADRSITIREAARLQSFPDSFVFPSSQSMVSVAKQIGNAVPPLLGAAVARAVLEHFQEQGRMPSASSHAGRQL